MKHWQWSSESVTEGHPDKICDQISDAIVDEFMRLDPQARVACETLATTGLVLVSGEISSSAYVDIPKIVRQTIREIGYNDLKQGFEADSCAILTSIDEQSPDIKAGVDKALESRKDGVTDLAQEDSAERQTGAGDQGMVYGYARRDNEDFMPLPIHLAHRICERLAELRKAGGTCLEPDGKSLVTVAYEGEKPVHIDAVVVSTQHTAEAEYEDLRRFILDQVLAVVLPADLYDEQTKIYINPSGRFVVGGPQGDTGLTGRKIIVDSYGAIGRNGGGAFSGKDPTKIDRSAAYAARYLAKNVVAADLANVAEIELCYAIGVAQPISVSLDCKGSAKYPEEQIVEELRKLVDLSPDGIIERFKLRRPIYKQVAAYGHFGRPDLDLPWEKTDLVSDLQKIFS
ncbi:MAG: methionine adenosyltransferase [Eubacteriales bacterium]|nr:methionine adenosyltransferase [Eubacteriales bacterium]